jgi:small multidrug resistance pump
LRDDRHRSGRKTLAQRAKSGDLEVKRQATWGMSGRNILKIWLFLATAIISEVIATSALKSSEGFTRLVPSFIVVAGYAAAFYFLSLTLKSIPVGIAYAVWSGLGIVLVTAIAWVLHGQKLDMWGFVGVGFIISGVAVLNLLSKASVH